MIALTWPTDSAVPHQSNHDTAYLFQSPSNSPPDCFLHQWYCILLAAQFNPSAIDHQSFQPTGLLLPSPYLPTLFSVQPELPASTPDLHSLQTCLSLRTINHLNILSHCLRLGPVQNKILTLRLDSQRHHKYFRMSAEQMDELLSLLGPELTRQCTNFRAAIEPKQRMAVALRLLDEEEQQGRHMAPVRNMGGNRASREACNVREAFCTFFNSPEGSVSWQDRMFLLVLPVRSLSHRTPELPANLPASSFTILACLVLSPA
ncbi:hypothetical protein F7725_013155 [Dissostichus mawsoni]|uniref:Uncharacterized protein n=1 Tax=Dissostichus mawsoni TaxID=36200 RepID=A0A7J5YQJ5_DISMA|nr:hypothetical protein F7725_013155 [Dissostichus mawsoni]